MNETMRVRQSCPCGANFTANGDASYVGQQSNRWRRDHESHAKNVPPGPCWHDSGLDWPDGSHPRCELLAGHAGAHEWDRGSRGGTAVWTDSAPDLSR